MTKPGVELDAVQDRDCMRVRCGDKHVFYTIPEFDRLFTPVEEILPCPFCGEPGVADETHAGCTNIDCGASRMPKDEWQRRSP